MSTGGAGSDVGFVGGKFMRRRCAIFATLCCAWLGFIPAGLAYSQDSTTSATPVLVRDLRASAAHDRALALADRETADGWRRLAEQARENAAQTVDPVNKQSYRDDADARDLRAAELEAEVKRLRAQADEKEARAARLEADYDKAHPPAPAPPPPSPDAGKQEDPALTLQDVLGYWRSTTDPSFPLVILPLGETKDGPTPELAVHTNKRVWNGRYTGATSGPLIVLTYTPKFEEMNSEIPEWARKAVEGKLVWRMEFEVQRDDIDPVLSGKWFPGEVQWSPEGVGPQTVSVTGDGKPYEFQAEPDYGIRIDELSQPTLGIKLATDRDYDPDGNPIRALIKGQRFFPRVTLPADMARKQVGPVMVTFEGLIGGAHDEVELKPLGQVGLRPVVYTTDEAVTIADCNAILEPLRKPPILSLNWIFGAAGHCLDMHVVNAETVELRYSDAFVQVPIYESWVQRGLARQAESVEKLRDALQAVREGKHPQVAKDAAAIRQRMLANYDAVRASDKLTDMHRFYLGELYFGDSRGPAILLMEPDVLQTYYANEIKRPENSDPSYFNPLVKAYMEGLTGKDLTPKAQTAGNNIVWTSDAEGYLVGRMLKETSDQLATDAVRSWVEQFAFGSYEGIVTATNAGQLYLVATGFDHQGQRQSGWDRFFAALSLSSTALLEVAGSDLAEAMLRAPQAARLAQGARAERTILADLAHGVRESEGFSDGLADVPKTVSVAQQERLFLQTAAELAGEEVAINCALAVEKSAPSTLVQPGAPSLGSLAEQARVERYVANKYGPDARLVGGWSEHPLMPLQTRPSCNEMAANRMILTQTGVRKTEEEGAKSIRAIMQQQLKETRFETPSLSPSGKARRGNRYIADFVKAGITGGYDQLAIRDYLRANGLIVSELSPAGNSRLKLRHVWSALDRGYAVKLLLKFDSYPVGPGSDVLHEIHAVVVEGLIVGNEGARPGIKAVRLYDSNVGRLLDVPAARIKHQIHMMNVYLQELARIDPKQTIPGILTLARVAHTQ